MPFSSRLLAIIGLLLLTRVVWAAPAPDAVVWHSPGQERGHLEACSRFKKLPEEERAGMDRITLEELARRGAELCSRCPGGGAPGKGNPQPREPEDRPETLPGSRAKPGPPEITKHEFVPRPRAPLISMGPDGKLIYRPFSDKGDKLMDWSYCGYKNSGVPIPMVPVVVTLEPPSDKAVKAGNMACAQGKDNRAGIQAAIDHVAAMKPDADGIRGAVLLKRGTHFVNGSILIRSGVVLRGEGDGEDGTVLVMTTSKGGGTAIRLGDPDAKIRMLGEDRAVRVSNAYLPSGSIKVDVEDASRFKVGNFIHVRKTTNQAWIDTLGMGERRRHIRGGREGLDKRPWVPEAYRPAHLRRITAIEGETITLDGVLPESIDQAHGGGIFHLVEVDALGTHSGIESLRIVSNHDTSARDTGKDANFMNFSTGIAVAGAYDPKTGPAAPRHANDRAGYWGTPQEGKYYGFALMGNGHIESPDKPVEPGSLFKQQLIDRIGKEKAAEVWR